MIEQTLKSPELICLIPSHKLNPEENYYNQTPEEPLYTDWISDRPCLKDEDCQLETGQEMQDKINNFEPQDENIQQIFATLKQTMQIEKIISVEASHVI